MDESLDSKRRHGRRPKAGLRADRRKGPGAGLFNKSAGGVKERWQLRSGPSCRCSAR